jgi:hypothetical protein
LFLDNSTLLRIDQPTCPITTFPSFSKGGSNESKEFVSSLKEDQNGSVGMDVFFSVILFILLRISRDK